MFSEEYPSNPPRVVILTTDGGKTRFNPNLYSCGKVCLSILGTWRAEAGEQWSAAQSAQSVLVSIQSLMDDMPYHNEPGYEKGSAKAQSARSAQACEQYNLKILHETLRVSICDHLEAALDKTSKTPFAELQKMLFMQHYARYLELATKHQDETGPFVRVEFEFDGNTMDGEFNFPTILERLKVIHDRIERETVLWSQAGQQLTADGDSFECQQMHVAHDRVQRDKLEDRGIGTSYQPDNLFVWDVSIYGGLQGTPWDNGMFSARMIFPRDFPDNPPRIKFETEVFHPHISKEGYPCLKLSQLDAQSISSTLIALQRVLKDDPDPNPCTWANAEAAELYFNQGEAGVQEYLRRVRRCAQRSMDG
mmetsp:Transcript_62745/g.136398  ORF Transcript_62745/g.136398 Transcript_62745/m.136398 type:complete len:364 (+) Transcript_62745:253-1344(+)